MYESDPDVFCGREHCTSISMFPLVTLFVVGSDSHWMRQAWRSCATECVTKATQRALRKDAQDAPIGNQI